MPKNPSKDRAHIGGMITTTPAIDPRTVETVLVAILDPEATLPGVARAAGMTVGQR